MFKAISGDYKGALYLATGELSLMGKGFNSTDIKLNNAEYIKVFKEEEIKEFLHNSEYALYTKDLQKVLKDTNFVCFEYKYQNGKNFIAISDLKTFHKIQEQSKIQIDEKELIREKTDKASCLGCFFLFIIVLFVLVGLSSCTDDASSNSSSMLTQHRIYCSDKVKANLNLPSTYKENSLASLSETETVNETDKVTIYFEAKNAFGVSQKYKARCIFNNTKNEMTYFNIKEEY